MAKQFYIPALGTEVVLAEDWSFHVVNDHRNAKLVQALSLAPLPGSTPGIGIWNGYYPLGTYPAPSPSERYTVWAQTRAAGVTACLPKGTWLKIDRIYIRKGAKDFDSVTFYGRLLNSKKSFRFFAKLVDVNAMVVEG
jgi:hypothetical protein